MERKFVECAFATADYAYSGSSAVDHIHGPYYRLVGTGEVREYDAVYDTPEEADEAGRAYLRRVMATISDYLSTAPPQSSTGGTAGTESVGSR